MLSYNFDQATQAELLEYFSAYLQVDGIIVFVLKNILKKGFNTPIVSLLASKDEMVDTVAVDIVPAVNDAVSRLRKLGHHHIAIAAEKRTHSRLRHFVEALGLSDEDTAVFVSENRFAQAGTDCAKQILASPVPYTAVLCTYDNIALGLIKHFTEQGYKVPDDFSVIGINNIPFSQYAEPSLSTIDEHIDEVCYAAWELLNKKMKNIYYRPPQPISFDGTLLLRESVSKARNT